MASEILRCAMEASSWLVEVKVTVIFSPSSRL